MKNFYKNASTVTCWINFCGRIISCFESKTLISVKHLTTEKQKPKNKLSVFFSDFFDASYAIQRRPMIKVKNLIICIEGI